MRSALFIRGGWEGHQPVECTDLFAEILRKEGFAVDCSETLRVLENAERVATYSVIVLCWTMGEISEDQVHTLLDTIRGGAGIAGWHGGMGDAFRTNCEYQFMVGGQFVAHPGGIIPYTVEIVANNHPITQGISTFSLTSEQYYMHTDPSNEVLAVTRISGTDAPWVTGCTMPVAWVRPYGKGRVFYFSPGHVVSDFTVPEAREIVHRGILWAARMI